MFTICAWVQEVLSSEHQRRLPKKSVDLSSRTHLLATLGPHSKDDLHLDTKLATMSLGGGNGGGGKRRNPKQLFMDRFKLFLSQPKLSIPKLLTEDGDLEAAMEDYEEIYDFQVGWERERGGWMRK